MTAPKILEKQVSESRVYAFVFSADMGDDETISSVDVLTSAPSGLTVGSGLVDGQQVLVRLSAGTNEVTYKVTCRITTNESNILECEGFLRVKNT